MEEEMNNKKNEKKYLDKMNIYGNGKPFWIENQIPPILFCVHTFLLLNNK